MPTIAFRLANAPPGAWGWGFTWFDGLGSYPSPTVIKAVIKGLDETFVITGAGLAGWWNAAVFLDVGSVGSGSFSSHPLTAGDGATYEIDGATWEARLVPESELPLGKIAWIIYLNPRTGDWQAELPANYVVGDTFRATIAVQNQKIFAQMMALHYEVILPSGELVKIEPAALSFLGGQEKHFNGAVHLPEPGQYTVSFVCKVEV